MKGNLYIHFSVEFPDSLTPEQCKVLEAFFPPQTTSQLTDMELDECEETTLHDVNFPPRMEWGEIDTTTPFESVKVVVTLFGEGDFGDKADGKRLELPVGERRIAKET